MVNIYLIATEIVEILMALGIFMKISPPALGLSILTWGNAIGGILTFFFLYTDIIKFYTIYYTVFFRHYLKYYYCSCWIPANGFCGLLWRTYVQYPFSNNHLYYNFLLTNTILYSEFDALIVELFIERI